MSGNQPTMSASDLLAAKGPVCLVIKAQLKPVGDTDRFQPAGFPEVGHVIYDAPRRNQTREKVCIVDSPASMANHLETVCMAAAGSLDLHDDLVNLPYVLCETDGNGEQNSRVGVCSTFTEGHRLASDYFLDSTNGDGTSFRQVLRNEFEIIEVKKDKTYFIPPETWWSIFGTVFKYDPNSLVHGVMFAKEQIKISRLLTAHLEAFGANRVGRSGVKFDRLQKTTSGQPIFSVDEETAESIQATFIIDLGLLRSYGRGHNGLSGNQKQLLLDLALWKVKQLLARPFRYRTQCFLGCTQVSIETEVRTIEQCPPQTTSNDDSTKEDDGVSGLLNALPQLLETIDIEASIKACGFNANEPTRVYYPAADLFKAGKNTDQPAEIGDDAQ
ncbi:MAG: type I-U CRISPR-associated RAMP protein Csb1/Cas7u [Planctomycetota bacterium]|nr:type I-U CRISPR-associated RAMP protein Csb1/Cas7u [Planctomycetota bacterium]